MSVAVVPGMTFSHIFNRGERELRHLNFLYSFFGQAVGHERSYFPDQGIEPIPCAVEAQSPNHWNTRKAPLWCFFFFFKIYYLFVAELDLHCCMQAFSSWGEWGVPL